MGTLIGFILVALAGATATSPPLVSPLGLVSHANSYAIPRVLITHIHMHEIGLFVAFDLDNVSPSHTRGPAWLI